MNENLFMGNQGVFYILESGWDGVDGGLENPLRMQVSKLVLITRGEDLWIIFPGSSGDAR